MAASQSRPPALGIESADNPGEEVDGSTSDASPQKGSTRRRDLASGQPNRPRIELLPLAFGGTPLHRELLSLRIGQRYDMVGESFEQW